MMAPHLLVLGDEKLTLDSTSAGMTLDIRVRGDREDSSYCMRKDEVVRLHDALTDWLYNRGMWGR